MGNKKYLTSLVVFYTTLYALRVEVTNITINMKFILNSNKIVCFLLKDSSITIQNCFNVPSFYSFSLQCLLFLYLLSATINASASSSVFTLNKTGTSGGKDSGFGKQTTIIVFLFSRFVGILSVNKVLSSKFPREVSARTINCVLPFGVGFKNNIPTPLLVK